MLPLVLSRLAPLALTSIAAALPQGTADWSSWRGPLGSGSAPAGSPPTHWSEKTKEAPAKNIAWKVEIPGLGISSPIVWQDRIYLTTAIATDRPGAPDAALEPPDQRAVPQPKVVHEFAVLAIDRRDGRIIWQKKLADAVPHEGGHRTNSHASSSPVTDGEHIYANFGSRGVHCLDMAGEVIWSKSLGAMRTRRQYGEGSSPAVYGDRVIVTWDHEGDSFLVTFDKRTGEELWRQPREEVTSWSTPVVVEVDGRTQVVVNATTASRGYDLHSGDVVWSLPGMTVNCIPIPIYAYGIAYLMSGYRGQMLQAVRLAGATGDLQGSKNVVWKHTRSTSYVPSATLLNGRLYFLRGNSAVLSCLDAKTGNVLYEGQRLPGLRQVYSSPIGADGRLYVTSRDGVTIVIADGPKFEQLAVNRLDDEVDASPAVIDDKIYLRGRRFLYCIAHDGSATGSPKRDASDSDKSTGKSSDEIAAPISYRRISSLGDATARTASVSIGDVDGDGDLDLVVANGRHWPGQNELFLNDLANNGNGSFSKQLRLGTEQSTTYTAALGDIDGDGDLDVIVGNDRQPSHVMRNDGKGHFVRGKDVGKISNTRSVTLADLDGQHGLDVILTNRNEANLICFNDGNGGFTRYGTFGEAGHATINVAAADLDGDGDLDIAVANRNRQQNHIYINDGHGAFEQTKPYGTGVDRTRGIAIADFDGDGHLDLINANIGEPNAIYFGDGTGRFPRSLTFGGAQNSYAIATGDVDGNGRLDIIAANADGPNAVYLQHRDGSLRAIPFGAMNGRTYGLVVADWNGDGLLEIATANSDGKNHLYQLDRR
jgi:outer membrane protein assembly factor BamB